MTTQNSHLIVDIQSNNEGNKKLEDSNRETSSSSNQHSPVPIEDWAQTTHGQEFTRTIQLNWYVVG